MNSFLSDEKVTLRHLQRSDIAGGYGRWFNDPEVVRHNRHGRFPMTCEMLEEYIAGIDSNMSLLVLAVVLKESNVHVGNISLQNINWVDRNADLAFILGETDYRGQGIMFQAGRLLIQHAFDTLNLHRLYCGTMDTNIGMKKLAVKLGMVEEGRRSEAIFKNGNYVDIVEYGLIKPI